MKKYFALHWEMDRWSGRDLLERKEFTTEKERDDWVDSINSKNTAKSVPEYYTYAEAE